MSDKKGFAVPEMHEFRHHQNFFTTISKMSTGQTTTPVILPTPNSIADKIVKSLSKLFFQI